MGIGDFSRIGTNVAALEAQKSLNQISSKISISQLRLSTGKRINTAEDDAAGFIIGKGLETRSRGLTQALSNIGDAKNTLAIAEGGLQSILGILQTMKEKATQAASDTLGGSERSAIENQLDDLAAEIDSIVDNDTTFNNVNLIDGTFINKSTQVGANAGDTLTLSITSDHDAGSLSVADASLEVSSATAASTAIARIGEAIAGVNDSIRNIGSLQARLTTKENTISTAITNTEAAKSRILDADLAKEQLEVTKMQILQQTALVMLAQANAAPQNVLQLLQ